MAQVYTRRLAAAALPDSVNQVLYTALDGEVTVVRDVVIANTGPTTTSVLLYMHNPGGGDTWLAHPSLAVDEVFHYDGRQELPSGHQLIAIAFSGTATIGVTGYRLVA